MPFPNWIGKERYWSEKRVLKALAAAAKKIRGPLPCVDQKYNELKKGRLDWPTSTRVLFYFHSMGRAWLAAGANPQRVVLFNIPWTDEEKEYLLLYAGENTLRNIAKHLRRSYGAVRGELRAIGIASRHNQGFMSAAEIAKEYGCPYHRVRVMIRSRVILAQYDEKRNRWNVDPGTITPELETLLRAPKLTHKNCPTDKGDYEKRHGLCRRVIGGKIIRCKKEV